MFTKLQLYILAGCLLATVAVFAVYEFWQRAPLRGFVLPTSVSGSGSRNSEDADSLATGLKSHRTLPETQFPDSYFKLTADSRTDVKATDGNQKVDAVVKLTYAQQKTNGGIILTFYSMELKMHEGTSLMEDVLMTRDKFVQQVGNQKTETAFDEMPWQQQQAAAGAFETNLCKITTDADQNELDRQILSEAGYAVLKDGNVNTVRLMHGPFHRTADRWQCVKRIPMANGFILDCPLEYSKAGGNRNEITISGSLAKDTVDSPQGLTMKNISFSLSGSEYFDETAEEYTSGKMVLQYKFQAFQNDAQIGSLEGRVELTLERVVTNKK
jgi:hypothetical protein